MEQIIKAASAIIEAEAKIELKPWERELINISKRAAEVLNPAENQKATEPSEEEVINLLKNL